MTFIFIIVICLCLYGFSFEKNGFRDDYATRQQTLPVNGIFVILVFLRHFKMYIDTGWDDRLFLLFDMVASQLIVVPFLFFSGYGVMLSLCEKGDAYIHAFPLHRLFKTWLHFALAVLLFVLAALLQGKAYPLSRILPALTGWDSVGNSNWFMFTTFVLYIITWVSARVILWQGGSGSTASAHIKKKYYFLAVCSILTILYMIIMSSFKDTYFYDTAFAWPCGMAFALFKRPLETMLQKDRRIYPCLVVGLFFILLISTLCKKAGCGIPSDLFWSLSFAGLLILVLMKIQVGNRILLFLGSLSFEIYILQRLPMNILSGWMQNKYMLFGCTAALTLLLAAGFRILTRKLDQALSL